MSPRGVPRRVTEAFESAEEQVVRIRVTLPARDLEQLQAIIAYRRGSATRSGVVAEAVSWFLVKQADWLLRAERQRQVVAERREKLERARAAPREERERAAAAQRVRDAMDRVQREDKGV